MSSQVETRHVKAPRSPFSRARFDNFYTHRERFRLRSQWWPPHVFLLLVPHLDKTTPILDDISYLVSRGWARSRQPIIGRLRSTDFATAITIHHSKSKEGRPYRDHQIICSRTRELQRARIPDPLPRDHRTI